MHCWTKFGTLTISRGFLFSSQKAVALMQLAGSFHLSSIIHSTWKCGISIGFYKKSATSGTILENSDHGCSVLACSHLFRPHETVCTGLRVTQPSYEDFCLLYSKAERHKRKESQRARTDVGTKSECEADFHQDATILEQLSRYD